MSIKLFSLAKELNIGVASLVTFLTEKGKEVENNPNSRISEEDFNLIINGYTPAFDEETVAKVKKKFLRKTASKPKAVVPEETPAAAPQTTSQVSPQDKPEEKGGDDAAAPKATLKVMGKIELDKHNNPVAKKNLKAVEQKEQPSPTITPSEVKVDAPAKKETPISQEKPVDAKTKVPAAKSEPETPQPAKQEVKPEPQKIIDIKKDKEAPRKSEDPVVQEVKKVEETPVKEVKEEKKDEKQEVFRINNTPEPELKVVGKIDLSALQTSRGKKKDHDKDATGRRKRKRIAGEAVDVKSEAAKGVNSRDNNAAPRNNNNNNERGGRNSRRAAGKPAKKRQEPTLTPEQEDEMRAKQVKETLARLNSKQTSFGRAAKSRREKREARRVEFEKEQELSSREEQVLKLTEFVTVSDLANMMNVPVTDVISTCMSIDMMVSINQRLDAETINIVAEEFGFETEFVSANVVEAIEAEDEVDAPEDLVPRPPVITIMGHVDHGKTTLLDRIRRSDVTTGEAGGITQHIGAYNVTLPDKRRITLLDTPGHEAFTAMRARGAQITDIAIIVIAANDAVMPQTIEAINHAAASGVPMIFAINKIDVPGAQPDKIREQLANMNYLVEDWGGKYQVQEISAKKDIGIPELLDKVLLEAELQELKSNPKRRAVGSIIESSLDKGRGYLATVLIQKGTLRIGDYILAGQYYGRVKAMFNEYDKRVNEANPSTAVSILGFNGAPTAGDDFNVMETEQDARELAVKREQLQREQGLRTQKMLTLDDIGRRIAVGNFKQFNLIIKGDVDGSVQALANSFIELSTDEIQVRVIHQGVGQVSESDVLLATASDAVIIGFQVRPSAQARKLAEKDGVEIRTYSVIYDAIEDVRDALEGMLSPEIKEQITANLEVLQTFKVSKVGTIAGCMVTEGKIHRTDKVRVIRDGIVIHTGELESLKRFKDEAKEVVSGLECGINIKNYNNIEVGDTIEAFEEIEVRKKL